MNRPATQKQSEAIRNRMQSIRSELPHAMDDARQEMKQFTDWKTYVRKFPLTTMVCAATAAYLAVPNRQRRTLAGDAKVAAKAGSSDKNTFLIGLLKVAAGTAIKTGASMAILHLSNVLLNSNPASPSEPSHAVPDENEH